MYLVDTNIWLERLLEQARSEEVRQFFNSITSEQIWITDFTFHSIAIVLCRLNRIEALRHFVEDVFIDSSVHLVHLEPEDVEHITEAMRQLNLDFDDAYQYAAAEKYRFIIVSFDIDFERTKMGKKTPSESLK